ESRWLRPFTESMQRLKRMHSDLERTLERVKQKAETEKAQWERAELLKVPPYELPVGTPGPVGEGMISRAEHTIPRTRHKVLTNPESRVESREPNVPSTFNPRPSTTFSAFPISDFLQPLSEFQHLLREAGQFLGDRLQELDLYDRRSAHLS